MPNEAQIDRVEQFFEDIRRLGGQAEQTAILTNLTVIDAAPVGLTGRIIIQDPRDGDFIPALTVPGINYNTGDLVNVLFVAGTEPIAYQQGSGSSTANVQVDRLWESDFGAVAWSTNATGDLSAAGAYDITTTGDLFVGNITATGNITLPNSTAIIGSGSSNPELGASASANRWGNIYLASSTFINALNSWEMSVGPIGSETVMLTLIDSAQDVLRLGIQPTSGADVDINFNDGQMFLEGSSGFLAIGRTTAFNYLLNLHEASSGAVFASFQNTTTGTTATDGFRVGIDAAERPQIWNFEATDILFSAGNTEVVRFASGGIVHINDSANTGMTIGLTINQGTADDEIFAGKSSDVAHGMTTITETDSFYTHQKVGGATGGLNVRTFTSSTIAYHLQAGSTTGDTTRSTAAVGAIMLSALQKSGTTWGAMGADENLVVIRDAGSARFLVDAEGDIHYDGTNNPGAWDTEDDTQILRALSLEVSDPATVVRNGFDEFVRYHKDDLIKLGVLSEGGFINLTQVTRVMMGALWQQHVKMQKLEAKLNGIN